MTVSAPTLHCAGVHGGDPAISIVAPALNEEHGIEDFLRRVSAFLQSRAVSWEILVVDDGSTDGTVARVEKWAARDPRVQLVKQPHLGKGAAVRRGMLAARGELRFMTDADLSVSPDAWSAFLDAAAEPKAADVLVGSREAEGARRIGEPAVRHLVGRVFNAVVRLLVMPGLHDTQCGFKLFRADVVRAVFPHLTVEGFAFDVELLFLARRAGFMVREVGVVWVCRTDTRVRFGRGAAAFADVVRIRVRQLGGRYRKISRHRTAPQGDHAAS